MKKVIYSLGTSTRSFEEFLEILESYRIEQVVDVRSFPVSKRFPHFSQEILKSELTKRRFTYVYLGKELGGYRKGGYENHLKTGLFKGGLKALKELAERKTTVFICAEKFPWKCHRRFIAQELEKESWQVEHIIEKDRVWIPKKGAG
jgi:uncharacterized protein (DUF488 family)